VQGPFNRITYLFEAFPEQAAALIMDESLSASQEKWMGSRERANNDPADLADTSGAFKRRGHLRGYEADATGPSTPVTDRALAAGCSISPRSRSASSSNKSAACENEKSCGVCHHVTFH
jgi:hypothetical protein